MDIFFVVVFINPNIFNIFLNVSILTTFLYQFFHYLVVGTLFYYSYFLQSVYLNPVFLASIRKYKTLYYQVIKRVSELRIESKHEFYDMIFEMFYYVFGNVILLQNFLDTLQKQHTVNNSIA